MRFNGAMLVSSSLSVLLSLNALAAPIRIVVVEKVAISDAEAFLRSVRLGHAAGADAVPDMINADGGSSNGPIRIPSFIHVGVPSVDTSEAASGPVAIPMRPEAEFNILPFPSPFLADSQSELIKNWCEKESHSWKARFGRASDWVRELLGLPAIYRSPCTTGLFNIPPPPPTFGRFPPTPMPGVAGFNALRGGKPCHNARPINISASDSNQITGGRFRRPGMWAARRPRTFSGRLQRALYSLSPWEGRALAFVLGCGLGVLLRMLYVFVVIGARALRCRSQSAAQDAEQEEPEEVVEGIILFDAGSIRAASTDDLPLYNEKD